jgi:chorismate mutase
MDIEYWRTEIDELDDEILRLLNMRARLALKVGALKKAAGLPINDPEREQLILARLTETNPGPLDSDATTRLFRRIIRESRRVESLILDSVESESPQLPVCGNGLSTTGARDIS